MVFANRTLSQAAGFLVATVAAAALLVPFAGRTSAADEAPAAVLKALAGTWTSSDPVDSTWTFKGEILNASVNGMDYTCKVKADAKAKPAELDILIEDGPEEAKGKTSRCIYKLDGETLTLCVSLPGKDRPKEFEQEEGEHYVFELKKEKPKDKKD